MMYSFPVDIANLASVSFRRGLTDYDCEDYVEEISKRFCRASSLLQKGEFLGVQLSLKDVLHGYAFTSCNAVVAVEDFQWIFQYLAEVHLPEDTSAFTNQAEDYRWYVITGQYNSNDASDESYSKYAPDKQLDYFLDMWSAMRDTQSAICFLIHSSGQPNSYSVSIIIGTVSPIPLRLRTALSLAFPETVIQELDTLSAVHTKQTVLKTSSLACCQDIESIFASVLESAIEKMPSSHYEDIWQEDVIVDDDIYDLDTYEYDEKTDGPEDNDDQEEKSSASAESTADMSDETLDAITDETKEPTDKNYISKLDHLIGLHNVKDQIKKIAAYAKMKKYMEESDAAVSVPVVLNMEFTGNPGTCKTTVARIMAGIFYELGLLSGKEIVEVGRADLVGLYVGHTADRVKSIFKKAKGKVLFIDEAYSLIDAYSSSYGDEAINTMVQEMENNRNDTIVIFAGYPYEMAKFFNRNPGFRSRVPFTIHFEDYTPEELVQISELEAANRGFSINQQASEKLLTLFETCSKDTLLGNGRLCRNIIENAILNYASRVYSEDHSPFTGSNNYILEIDDFSLPKEFKSTKSCMGFQI